MSAVGARIAVVGSRDFPRPALVLVLVRLRLPAGTTVVSGAARGVDSIAKSAADERGLPCVEFPADWSKGRGAGFARNTVVVENCDAVIAFWDGASRGTLDTARKAVAAGKPVWVFGVEGEAVEVAPW